MLRSLRTLKLLMNLQALRSEKSLARVVRLARKEKEFTYILFVSPWDVPSQVALEYVEGLDTNDITVYTVDYFEVPQSWTQFKVKPGTMVKMNDKKVVVYPGRQAIKCQLR